MLLDLVSPLYLLAALPVIVLVYHFASYVVDPHGIRSIPGPFFAKFSDAWLVVTSAKGHRSEIVHELHAQKGIYVPTSQ